MATWQVKFFPYNIFELGTITATAEDSGFPAARLGDLDASLFWKCSVVSTAVDLVVQQPSNRILDVDFYQIPKHNFLGLSCTFAYSSDGSNWTTLAAFSPGDYDPIVGQFGTVYNKKYWRFRVVTGLHQARATEIWISKAYAFNALREQNPIGHSIPNVQWNRTVGGLVRPTKRGTSKRVRTYTFWMDATEFASFLEVVDHLDDYSKPFYFQDHRGDYFLSRFDDGSPEFDFNHNTHTRVTARILEI